MVLIALKLKTIYLLKSCPSQSSVFGFRALSTVDTAELSCTGAVSEGLSDAHKPRFTSLIQFMRFES